MMICIFCNQFWKLIERSFPVFSRNKHLAGKANPESPPATYKMADSRNESDAVTRRQFIDNKKFYLFMAIKYDQVKIIYVFFY